MRENIALALQARQGLWPAISRIQQTTMAEGYVKALGIKTADVDTPIGQLSGGNQQKAVLARWLARTMPGAVPPACPIPCPVADAIGAAPRRAAAR